MKLAIIAGATLMLVSTLGFAGPIRGTPSTEQPARLAPGKAAGIQQARSLDNATLDMLVGLAARGNMIGTPAATSGAGSPAPNSMPALSARP